MVKLLSATAIAVAVPFSMASAEQVGTAEHISSALSACLDATSTSGVNEARLDAAGFKQGTIESEGKAIETPLRIFGRSKNPAMIVTMQTPRPACSITSRIVSFKSYPAIAEAITRELGSQPIKQEGNDVFWRRGNVVIHLAATGSQKKPSIRAGVVAVQGEKK